MKIAFCLSGQLRTWKECYKSWELLFDELRSDSRFHNASIEVDYFIHTWDFNTVPPHEWGNLGFPQINWAERHFKIDQSEIDEMIQMLNPKKILIENSDKCRQRKGIIDNLGIVKYNNPNGVVVGWSAPQLYSIMRSGELKNDYEVENEIIYDICIKHRFDGFIAEHDRKLIISNIYYPLKRRTIHSMHSRNLHTFPHDLVGDIFFFSDSETYNILTSFYNWVPVIPENIFNKGVKIEEVFGYYIRMFNINNIRTDVDVKIIRQDISKLLTQPLNELRLI